MGWFVSAVTTAMTAFAATNIDDIVILMIFFAQVNEHFRPKHIVTGQYLGFLVILLASLPGYLGGLVIPKAWIGLLGLLPIWIGIQQWRQSKSDDAVDPPIQTVSPAWLPSADRRPWVTAMMKVFSPPTYQVAAVTVANGGDNIGIYVPLFASSNLAHLSAMISTFLVLIGVWCWIAYYFSRHPHVSDRLTQNSSYIVPFVLIGLGLYLLIESGSYQLLFA